MLIVLFACFTRSRDLLTNSLISEYLSMADRAGVPWERLPLNVLEMNNKRTHTSRLKSEIIAKESKTSQCTYSCVTLS